MELIIITDKDTFAESINPNRNYDAYNDLTVGGNDIVTCIAYINYPLVNIPQNAYISGGALRLYSDPTSPGTVMNIGYTIAPWGETTLTWNNMPNPTRLQTHTPVPQSSGWHDYTVNELAEKVMMYKSTPGYVSVVLSMDVTEQNRYVCIYGRTRGTPPQLIIEYTEPAKKIAVVQGGINKTIQNIKLAPVQGMICKSVTGMKIAPVQGPILKTIF